MRLLNQSTAISTIRVKQTSFKLYKTQKKDEELERDEQEQKERGDGKIPDSEQKCVFQHQMSADFSDGLWL